MQLQTDHIGFPLLFIEELGMWTNLIPITKVQFEYYLCDRDANRSLDNAWYSERLKQNPRVTARRLSMNDYHQCFMTSLLPQEADYFANWAMKGLIDMGVPALEYRLPYDEEWKALFRAVDNQPTVGGFESLPLLKPRARDILNRLEQLTLSEAGAAAESRTFLGTRRGPSKPATLADQMLLRRGIYEMVRLPHSPDAYGGRGAPPSTIGGKPISPDAGEPIRPGQTDRHPYVGARFLMRVA